MGGKNSKTSNTTTGTSGSIYSVPSNEANNNDVQGETKTTIDFTTEEKEVGLKLLQKVNLLNAIKLVALGQSIQSNDSAMAALTLLVTQLGLVKVGAEAVHVDAKLPPELENFNVLKEEKNVAAALQDKHFVEAQEAVQEKPKDSAALAALQAVVANAHKVYDSTIQARLQEVDLNITCRKVVHAGNDRDFTVPDLPALEGQK
jgi:hypothetical protein